MGTNFIFIILIVLAVQLARRGQSRYKRKYFGIRGKRTTSIFDTTYLEGKAFFMYYFRSVPNTTCINDIQMDKSFKYISDTYQDEIIDVYQSCYFDWEKGQQVYNRTMFVLSNKVIIELGDDYVDVYFKKGRNKFASDLLEVFRGYKLPEKEEEFEINIITLGHGGLVLKRLDIKPASLDVDMYYNDDFKEIDAILQDRLNRQDDKGIALLYGLPGTGKTTYLRYLIGKLKKKVLFISPSVAGNLMDPGLIDLLIGNQNAVLIIEDAENIIMDRKYNSDSSVSNLLNLSDGLLSDCLNVQIICTFNSALSLVDTALMRKGRLIAKYEFGKLSVEKSQALSKHLGFETAINIPMTIADIANQKDKQYEIKKVEVLGFRKCEVEMN